MAAIKNKKIKMKKFIFSILIFASLGFPKVTYSQPNNNLDIDPTLIKKKLPNGLTYYIKHIPDAGEDIFMRFYINAGNRVETSNQPDVSHAIEHLAFRTTKNFPLGISNYSKLLNEVGMKGLGWDIYAWSGTQGTEYIYNAKSNNPESVELGILWFQDILNGLDLTNKDIEIERKTLIQERESKSSMNRSNQAIIESKLFKMIFPCQRSQDGYKEKINNFAPKSLRKYYKDWYQPKNVAIVLAGNIPDLNRLDKEIRKKFSSFQNEKEAREVPNCDIDYFNRPNQFKIVKRTSDSINQFVNKNIKVNMFYRDSLLRSVNNYEGVRRQILWELTIAVLRNHLQQLTQSYKNNFNVEVVNIFKHKNLPAASSIIIKSEEKNLSRAILEVMSKINEVRTYGITTEEWDNLKNKQLYYLEIINNERDENPRFWIDDIKRNFWFNEPLLSQKYHFLKAWMTQIELEDYNKFLEEVLSQMPQDIGIVVPDNENFKYSEIKFRSLIQENLDKPVSRKNSKTPKSLLSNTKLKKLNTSTISLIGNEIYGGKEYRLKNGIRMVLLKDETASEHIQLWGFSSKGASSLPPEQLYSAIKAPDIIKHAGLGEYNKFEVDRFLKSIGGNIQVKPYINFSESGIKGRADIQNMEVLLQMVHLYFTAPRKDEEAFKHWKRKELQAFLIPSYSVSQTDFDNAVYKYFGKSEADFLSGTYHFEGTRKANLESAYKAYQTLLSEDISNFTFIITGKFDEEFLLTEVRKYLGNLKSAKGTISNVHQENEKNDFPKGPTNRKLKRSDYYQMENVIYSIRYAEKIDKYDWRKHLQVQLLSELIWEIAIKLRTEEEFALYDIIHGGVYHRDLSFFEVYLKLSCLPDEVNKIKIASRKIFKKIKDGEIDQILFEKVSKRLTSYYSKNGRYRDKEAQLHNLYSHGNNLVDFEEMEKFLKKLTYKDLQEFARSFIVEENQYEFIM